MPGFPGCNSIDGKQIALPVLYQGSITCHGLLVYCNSSSSPLLVPPLPTILPPLPTPFSPLPSLPPSLPTTLPTLLPPLSTLLPLPIILPPLPNLLTPLSPPHILSPPFYYSSF